MGPTQLVTGHAIAGVPPQGHVSRPGVRAVATGHRAGVFEVSGGITFETVGACVRMGVVGLDHLPRGRCSASVSASRVRWCVGGVLRSGRAARPAGAATLSAGVAAEGVVATAS